MPLESAIVKAIKDYLKTEVDSCVVEKVHGSALQVGRPDLNGCWKGRSFRIEVKSPDHGNKPSKLQIMDLNKWSKAGSLCFVAYSLEEVKVIINNDSDPWYTSIEWEE